MELREQAQLEFTSPSGQQQTIEIDESPFRIGRSRGNYLSLPGTEVSREHAEITLERPAVRPSRSQLESRDVPQR